MINKLRNIIAEYVSKNSDIQNWENIRELFGAYSYLMFLFISTKSLGDANNLIDMQNVAKETNLEKIEIMNDLLQLQDAKEFVYTLNTMIGHIDTIDLPVLYQEFLSIDFVLDGEIIGFESGKNARDVLGSYYTQEDFARLITQKALDDYYKLNPKNNSKVLKIVDYSCGSAAFLIPALKICLKKGIRAEIYGYDVDPIAVVISRALMAKNFPQMIDEIFIFLGNPLLEEKSDTITRFRKAIQGRYYNNQMGINPVENMDIVLGNPPWEKIRFEEKKFLHHYMPAKEVRIKSDREKLLHSLSQGNMQYYTSLAEDYANSKKQLKESKFFKYSNCGELNTYALFTEFSNRMIAEKGIVSLIVKSSLFKLPVYSTFFNHLTKEGALYQLFMFVNRDKIFNIDSREEFSVLYLTKGISQKLQIALNLNQYTNFDKQPTIELTYDELHKLNPETGMIPSIKNSSELKFLLNMANHHDIFDRVYEQCRFGRLVHLTNHSSAIKAEKENGYLAIYEGKFIELYTGKFATFGGMTETEKYKNKATAKTIDNPQGTEYPESRFYIKEETWKNISKNFPYEYVIAWRSLTASTNRRTMLATILPLLPTCQSIQLLQMDDLKQMLHVLALFNSIVFDYMVRLKMVGLDLTQTIIKQIPVPAIKKYDEVILFNGKNATISQHLLSRIKMLYEDDYRINKIFKTMDIYEVHDQRKVLIADIDKIIAMLYGISKQELKKIALSFTSFYTKEEVEVLY